MIRPAVTTLAVAGLLAAAVTPAQAADPLPARFDLTPRACPVASTPLPGLGDIGASALVTEIACIAAHGISVGVTPTTFDPRGQVTRRQMATFLYRLAARVTEVRFDTTDAGFDDVGGVSGEQLDAINALANAGVALGRGDGAGFAPNDPVTRQQMAAFLERLQLATVDEEPGRGFGELFSEPADDPGPRDYFDDDDGEFEDAINALAYAGVTLGAGPGTYRPSSAVTREQMAAFLSRVLGYDLTRLSEGYDGTVDPWLRLPEESFAVQDKALRQIATGGDDPREDVTFVGLPAGSYRVSLFDARAVASGGTEAYGFVDVGRDGRADRGVVGSVGLVAVDGAPVPSAQDLTVSLSAPGSVTVTVQASSLTDGAVVPVLHTGGPTADLDVVADEGPLDAEVADGQRYAVGPTLSYALPSARGFASPDLGPTARVTATRYQPDQLVLLYGDGVLRLDYGPDDAFVLDGAPLAGVPELEEALSARSGAGLSVRVDDVGGTRTLTLTS